MTYQKLVFRVHAIQRMFERSIQDEDVRTVLRQGEVIEAYPDDTPYPSYLMLGWVGAPCMSWPLMWRRTARRL